MFKKYPSILNHYRSKEIEWWTQQYPGLLTAEYEIQEKIHGANIQLIFSHDNPPLVASRNRVLEHSEDFYEVKALLSSRHEDFIYAAESQVAFSGTMILYGEIFGPGIQKGVKYGTEKQIVFFDMIFNDIFQSPLDARWFFDDLGYSDLFINRIATVDGLNNALEFHTEMISGLGPDEHDNLMEGVVIKPLNAVYQSPQGSRFYIKKKNEAFKEKAKAKKPPVDTELERLHLEFLSYITPMRLQTVFSKHGEIDSPSQIGEYIKLVLADAKEDFEQEQEIPELNKKDLKYIYNVGSMIANMLKGYL
jgi:Rnl2 family RNA ligase